MNACYILHSYFGLKSLQYKNTAFIKPWQWQKESKTVCHVSKEELETRTETMMTSTTLNALNKSS